MPEHPREPPASEPQDTSGDRATVALVNAKLDGLRGTTEAGLAAIQRQLDHIAGVPERLSSAEERLRSHDRRIELLEDRNEAIGSLPTQVAELKADVDDAKREGEKGVEWHRFGLPMIGIGLLAIAANIAIAVLNAH